MTRLTSIVDILHPSTHTKVVTHSFATAISNVVTQPNQILLAKFLLKFGWNIVEHLQKLKIICSLEKCTLHSTLNFKAPLWKSFPFLSIFPWHILLWQLPEDTLNTCTRCSHSLFSRRNPKHLDLFPKWPDYGIPVKTEFNGLTPCHYYFKNTIHRCI